VLIPSRRVGCTVLTAVLLGTACGGSSAATSSTAGSPAAAASTATVVIKNIAYSPTAVTISAGGSVTWRFEDAPTPHTVTSNANLFGSAPNGMTSGTFQNTFAKAGTYSYYCDFHPQMKGTVTVR
jgi:plastocyanin